MPSLFGGMPSRSLRMPSHFRGVAPVARICGENCFGALNRLFGHDGPAFPGRRALGKVRVSPGRMAGYTSLLFVFLTFVPVFASFGDGRQRFVSFNVVSL